jgi:hypothetical protein
MILMPPPIWACFLPLAFRFLLIFLLFNKSAIIETVLSVGDRMINEHGGIIGMKIGRGSEVLRKRAPVPFCPPHIPNDLTWD